MNRRKSFTLTEVMIAIVIMVFAILGILNVSTFYSVQAKSLMELADCQAQLNFAAEDIKLHLMSADAVSTTFTVPAGLVGTLVTRGDFTAHGENDVFTITPNNPNDNKDYTYTVSAGKLVRTTGVITETLVDQRYTPEIQFVYTKGDPPNFMTVEIKGHTRTKPLGKGNNEVSRLVGIRFWFVDIAI